MSGLGTKQLILLPALLGMNYIDFETPNTVNMVITGYVTMQAITLSICFMVYRSIESKRGQQGHTQRFLVKAPPLPFGQENPTPDKMMNATEYDISKLNEIVKQILMGICVISFIFYKVGDSCLPYPHVQLVAVGVPKATLPPNAHGA